jgi:hypothetical protein
VKARAAVLAADAPEEVGNTASIMGASIRSTIGVPLWRGDEILGVLQVDNRNAPGMLGPTDLELCLVLAANASLAVANARLIKRLVLAEERLQKENSFLKGREEKRRGGGKPSIAIIGDAPPMREVMRQLDKVVDTRVTVLIEGETGTGKELIAAAVHYKSRRRDKLFVAQNCAALAESLWRASSSVTKRALLPGQPRRRRACSRSPTAARCSSTRSPRRPSRCSRSSCARCKRARSAPSARRARNTSTCASSRPPTATSRKR